MFISESNRRATAANTIFLVGILSVLVGFIAQLGVEFLKQMGAGGYSILSGAIFLILGYFVLKDSKLALIIAIVFYVLDGIVSIGIMMRSSGSTAIGSLLFHGVFAYYMIRGLPAMEKGNIQTPKPVEPVVQEPRSTNAPATIHPLSFVASSAPLQFDQKLVDPAEAERLRLELTRSKRTNVEKPPASRIGSRSHKADLRSQPESDLAASTLRFVSYKCEIQEDRIRATFKNGSFRELFWPAISTIIVRQLPAGDPWQGKILVDLLGVPAPGIPQTPLRLFSTTYVNYFVLPQGAAHSSQENLRRLAVYIASKNKQVQMDRATEAFVHGGQPALRFFKLSEFAEYDARYKA